MAYGRLDVFWPDGKFETYLLDKTTTSVGRSPGCTIVLDTDTISRYHFSLTANDAGNLEIADMDSANGTFIDGVRLKPNETRIMQGGEELQIGHLRMIYHHIDEQPTVPMETIAEETQRFAREDLGFRMDIYGPEIAVPPGSHTSIELSIYNDSDEAKRFTITLAGLPEGWARINRPELEIKAKDSAPVLINIKPLIHSDSKPGDYNMQVVLALKNNPETRLEGHASVRILPYVGFGMALATKEISPYEAFHLHLHNQGSIGLPVFVMGRSRDNALQFKIPQAQMILSPGQRFVVKGEVLPTKRRIFGASRLHEFDLMVRSRDDAAFLAAVRGTYVEMAILPQWAVVALGILALAAATLLAIAVFLILQVTPTPEIQEFRVDTGAVVRGDPLAMGWVTDNADTVTINVNGEPVLTEVDAAVGSAQIMTDGYRGEINVQIIAINEDHTVTSNPLTVTLLEPLVIETFIVEPTAMARNVVQPVSANWVVNGATSTSIQGLGSMDTNGDIQSSYGPTGEISVQGVPPNDAFAVILVAEDDRGNTLTELVEIALFDPVCTAAVDGLRLYTRPNVDENTVSTLSSGDAVTVNAQSQDNLWLRTSNAGVQVWGLRENLICEDSFDPNNLVVDPTTIPALPEATPETEIPVQPPPTPGS